MIDIVKSADLEYKTYEIEEIQKFLKDFDLIQTLMFIQKVSALMGNQVHVNINIGFEYYNSPKRQLKSGIITKEFIAFASKAILQNCKQSPRKFNELDLINLIVMYDNLRSDLHEIKAGKIPADQQWLWVIRATNHQWYYMRLLSNIIARYYWLFKNVYQNNPHLGNKLDQDLGIDFFDAIKIGTCFYANFYPGNGRATCFLMTNYTQTDIPSLKSLLTEENINKYFNIFSINADNFSTECSKFSLAQPSLIKYEFNPLKRFPVVKTDSSQENEKYIFASIPDLLYASSEGLYYVLLDKLDETNKDLLFKEMGLAFEIYIGELLKHYNIDILSRAKVFSEIKYKVGSNELKTADWLLISEDYIIQIECKKRKIDVYSKAGIQNEDGTGIDSFIKDLAKQIDKFSKKEEHIKNGKVPGVNYAGQKVIHIIVYLDELFAINKYAITNVKAEMKKTLQDFYVFGCWEFELVCQQCRNKQQNIFYSIQDIINEKENIFEIDFLNREYDSFFKELMGR